jgi:hypothetical protein
MGVDWVTKVRQFRLDGMSDYPAFSVILNRYVSVGYNYKLDIDFEEVRNLEKELY